VPLLREISVIKGNRRIDPVDAGIYAELLGLFDHLCGDIFASEISDDEAERQGSARPVFTGRPELVFDVLGKKCIDAIGIFSGFDEGLTKGHFMSYTSTPA
jgi:hypothetical protein